MADTQATIDLEVKGLAGALAKLKTLESRIKKLERSVNGLSSGARQSSQALSMVGNTAVKVRRHFDEFDKGVKMMGMGLSKVLGLALKGTILQMGLLSASLLGVHALFIAGKALHKVYSGGMQLIAGGAASAAIALGTMAAAIREQQAAMYAYRGKGAKEFGAGINQVRVAMRNLQMDASIAGLGTEALNKAFAAMAKTMTSSQISGSGAFIKNLMDFGAAGQDPTQAAEKVGAIIAALNDSKKSMSDVKAAAKELGPEMEAALKKAGSVSKTQLKQLILSGELAKMGGVAGQFDAVNQTLIGQAKTFFNLLKGQFADFGQSFLEPAKVAMQKIMKIIQRDLMRVSHALTQFGAGSVMDGLVTAVDKVSNFFVTLITDWLPKTEGMFDRVGGWWERTQRFFKSAREQLRPFIDGARVIEDALKPIGSALKESFVGGINDFNDSLLSNRQNFIDFGERIAELVTAISTMARVIREALIDALPFINKVLAGVTQIFGVLTSVISRLTSTFGGAGGLMAYAIMARQMKNTRGGFINQAASSVGPMTVNSPNVVVNGGNAGVGGPGKVSAGAAPGRANIPFVPANSPSNTGPGNRQAYGVSNAGRIERLNNRLMGRLGGPVGFVQNKVLGPLSPGGKLGGGMGQQLRNIRANSPAYTKIFGDQAKGISGINNSMSARMGVGMGMMALSSIAPSEMQGALALGGMVGQFNPMAGLAVGLGGAAMKAKSATGGAAMGAGAGAIIGSMIAPGIGTAVGAALGGVMGGINGALNRLKAEAATARRVVNETLSSIIRIDSVSRYGTFQRNIAASRRGESINFRGAFAGSAAAQARRLRTLSGEFGRIQSSMPKHRSGFGNFMANPVIALMEEIEAVPTGFGRLGDFIGYTENDTEEARRFTAGRGLRQIYQNQAKYGISISKEQYAEMENDPVRYLGIYQARIGEMLKASDSIATQEEKRLKALTDMSGKSSAELEVLAHSLGVNLYDPLVEFDKLVEQLGINARKSADQMKQMNIDNYVNTLQSSFGQAIKQIQAPKIADEIARGIRDKLMGGGASAETLLADVEKLYNAAIDLSGGDAIDAFFRQREQLGTLAAPGRAFQPGGAFAGVNPAAFFSPQMTQAIGAFEANAIAGFAGTAASDVSGFATQSGLSLNQNALKTAVAGLKDRGTQERFLKYVQSGQFGQAIAADAGLTGTRAAEQTKLRMQEQLKLFGIDPTVLGIKTMENLNLNTVGTDMVNASEDFKTAVNDFKTNTDDIFQNIGQPSWWDKAPKWWEERDTSSARGSGIGDSTSSRLSQTMARHASINGQLAGSRSITSAYRNYALGSPSSDHLAGRAIDLVGQNLGRYAVLTRESGGFAEFHGRGSGRHLHVVPGPGAIGDSMSPAPNTGMTVSVGASKGGGGNSYVFNVYGGSDTADVIANTVMAKIKMTEKNARERI